MPVISHYELLGLQANATTQEIKVAWSRARMLWHPDKSVAWVISETDKSDASEIFGRIKTAYDTLVVPQSRQQYDYTFKPMPTTIPEELFQNKWERLNKQCMAYEQRGANPGNYIAFLKLQINQLQSRQGETSHQLNLLGGHVSQFDKLLQDNVVKMDEQAQMIRALQASQAELARENAQQKDTLQQAQAMQASQARLLQENAELKRQLQQVQIQPKTGSSLESSISAASVSQVGNFAAKATNKLTADGLTAVLKITEKGYVNKNSLEWYWVKLKFADAEKAVAFKEKYYARMKKDWTLQILFSTKDGILDINLVNSAEYLEVTKCHEKTGMMIMRELAKYVDIENTPQFFCDASHHRPIPDAELPEEFINKFLRFELGTSTPKPSA